MSPAEAASASGPEPGRRDLGARTPLANPNFRRLWLAETVSQMGDGLTSLAILVVINRLTGSVTALAALAITASLPQLVFGLHAGVIADRMDRRRLMIASDLLRGLAVLSLAWIHSRAQVPWLYVVGFFQATVGVVFEPARSAFLPSIVEPPTLLAANALAQTARVSAGVAGAAIAGLLLTLPNGAALAFALDALSFWVSAVLVARIAAVARAATPVSTPGSGHLEELLQGLRYLFGNRMLIGLFVTFAIAMLGLGAVNVLFIPFLVDVLHCSSALVGFARGAQMAGLLVGGLAVSALAGGFKPTALVVFGICGLGLSFAALGLLRWPAPVVGLLAVIGLCSSALQAGAGTLLQQSVPDALRSRLESSLDTLLVLVLMFSMAGAGLLSDAWGVRSVLLLAGAAVVIAGLVGSAAMSGVLPSSSLKPDRRLEPGS
jgi:MFS family permease